MLANKMTEIFPKKGFSQKRKLEAIVRFLAYLTIVIYLCTRRVHTLIVGVITIGFIYVYSKLNKQKTKEGFANIIQKVNVGQAPTENNPLMNVLMTEYTDNPKRSEAVLANTVTNEINDYACNPEIYSTLGDNYECEQSMRQFYTMPSTTIPNNQGDFGKFCYGDMPSCKEGHPLQCEKNNSNNRRIF